MSKPSGGEPAFKYSRTPTSTIDYTKREPCGVRTTDYPAIANAHLPADGPGSDSFSNWALGAVLLGVPYYMKWKVGGGLKTFLFFAIIVDFPLLAAFWLVVSAISPRKNEKAKYPGRGVEHYLDFKKEADRLKYRGSNKIPMEHFYEMYFDGDVDFKGDALEMLEYRHDWASFRFTPGLIRHFLFEFIPNLIFHTQAADTEQIQDTYDRGNDFYGFFLGPRMIYTSGLIGDINKEETLEELQDNKMAAVCEKIGLKEGETMLDIGCGWGTLVRFASEIYGAKAVGVTIARNQTSWGNNALRKAGIPEEQSRIECKDYRDIPVPEGGYKKITCLEMIEHVGVRHFSKFLTQVRDMLDDDGVLYIQYAGLRKSWQYEDLIWGLFMNKYVFPGADASAPLGWSVDKFEGAGFEIKSIDTIGVHYSATLWRWYRNWLANESEVKARYGARWFRIWEFFLSWSVIASRQGSATCFQITLVKNINSTHRVEGIPNHHGVNGAREACKGDLAAWAAKNNAVESTEFTD